MDLAEKENGMEEYAIIQTHLTNDENQLLSPSYVDSVIYALHVLSDPDPSDEDNQWSLEGLVVNLFCDQMPDVSADETIIEMVRRIFAEGVTGIVAILPKEVHLDAFLKAGKQLGVEDKIFFV